MSPVRDRGRRTRYDNIAAGSSFDTRERTIAGDTVSPVEMHGGGFSTSTSTGDVWHTNIAAGVSVSEQAGTAVVGGELPENVVATATTNTDENVG